MKKGFELNREQTQELNYNLDPKNIGYQKFNDAKFIEKDLDDYKEGRYLALLAKSDTRINYYCWEIYRKKDEDERILLGNVEFNSKMDEEKRKKLLKKWQKKI